MYYPAFSGAYDSYLCFHFINLLQTHFPYFPLHSHYTASILSFLVSFFILLILQIHILLFSSISSRSLSFLQSNSCCIYCSSIHSDFYFQFQRQSWSHSTAAYGSNTTFFLIILHPLCQISILLLLLYFSYSINQDSY